MPTLTCTPAGGADNSYATLATADAYFADTLREEAWVSYTATQREQALIQATSELEGLGGARSSGSASRVLLHGEPFYPLLSQQNLHFPRTDDLAESGSPEIPGAVVEAVCEQAYWLLGRIAAPDLIDTGDLRARGVNSISQDGLSVSLGKARVPDDISPRAWRRFSQYVRTTFPIGG